MKTFMEIACDEALMGMKAGDGGPFGAVIVKDNKIVAVGHNQVLASQDSTAHAEIVAIRSAEKILATYDLSGCEIYTSCFPCPMCLGAIMWARISRVYYGCSTEDAATIGFDDRVFYEAIAAQHHPIIQMDQLESHTCLDVFREWMKLENKQRY